MTAALEFLTKRSLAAGGLVVVAAGLVLFFVLGSAARSVDGILEASGVVEGIEVVVGTVLPGRVTELAASEGDAVRLDQVLARIDADQLETRLRQAEAGVQLAREQVSQAEAAVTAAANRAEQARLAWQLAARNETVDAAGAEQVLAAAKAGLARARLAEKQAGISMAPLAVEAARREAAAAEKSVVQAQAALDLARSGLAVQLRRQEYLSAVAAWKQARAALGAAEAGVSTAEAARDEARVVLEKAVIRSPAAGTVVDRLAEPGELVAAGSPLLTIVDMDRLKVTAYITGADLAKVRLGNEARVFIDGFPGKSLTGRVAQIGAEAEFTPKTAHMKEDRVNLVYAVKVRVEEGDGVLKPGMPADIEIRWNPGAAWSER